ncbi:MAG TPA: dethiobiotin synthase [Nitrospirae bacterium]|nr:ATP-dependent dethiobiotin synthetase BioD 1 [bacterium BMS3Bbin09]HDO66946.1 dethiobiotin synthase [Nitrospirota bacterium]HEW81120.1 dethiobiotin synthase [Nitrospirota bacterium]
MHKGIFITGTDTSIGKTFVAEGLIRAIKTKGLSVCPMKPVESGCSLKKGELFPNDAVRLLKASGIDETLDAINPYRLRNPLAPAVAAELENINISKKKILSAYRRLSKKYDMTVVEGAGGIMVPVYKKYLFLDLAKDLGLPLLIVARPGLGTINHTLLTIEAARNRGLDVAGVVINYANKTRMNLSVKTSPKVIEKLGKVPVLGTVPYIKNPADMSNRKVFEQIANALYLL